MLEKLAAIQMIDVEFAKTDGRRTAVLSRHTEPQKTISWPLLQRLNLSLPARPRPKITVPLPSGLVAYLLRCLPSDSLSDFGAFA